MDDFLHDAIGKLMWDVDLLPTQVDVYNNSWVLNWFDVALQNCTSKVHDDSSNLNEAVKLILLTIVRDHIKTKQGQKWPLKWWMGEEGSHHSGHCAWKKKTWLEKRAT